MSEEQVLPELDITEEDKHRAYRYCGARFGSDVSREALIDDIAGAYRDEIRAVHREKSETYCRERQLAQSEAERERLQGEVVSARSNENTFFLHVVLPQLGCKVEVKGGATLYTNTLAEAAYEEIAKLTAELARERGLHQGLREATLTEALKAVENERLENHDEALKCFDDADDYDTDAAYSRAIDDAESAIKQLLEDKSKPVATTAGEGQ